MLFFIVISYPEKYSCNGNSVVRYLKLERQ